MPEIGNDNVNENQQNLGNEQVLKLVADLQAQVAELKKGNAQPLAFPTTQGMSTDDIAKLIAAAVNTRDRDLDFQAGIKEEDIPEGDYLDKPIRFCAPFAGYVIVDDTRKGHRVLLPYNKKSIFFEYVATRRVQQGKYESTAPYSIYECKSQKEAEWLRSHSLYNTLFYETSTQAVSMDVVKMQKLARIMTILQRYEFHDLIKRCKEYNVAVGEDPAAMRANLAYAMVDSELKSEQLAAERLLGDTAKEAMIVGKS